MQETPGSQAAQTLKRVLRIRGDHCLPGVHDLAASGWWVVGAAVVTRFTNGFFRSVILQQSKGERVYASAGTTRFAAASRSDRSRSPDPDCMRLSGIWP